MVISVGYESYLDTDNLGGHASQLSDPQRRILCEIFWPYINGDCFDVIKKRRSLIEDEVLSTLHSARENGKSALCVQHALAVAYHRRYIGVIYSQASSAWI